MNSEDPPLLRRRVALPVADNSQRPAEAPLHLQIAGHRATWLLSAGRLAWGALTAPEAAMAILSYTLSPSAHRHHQP
jgi:hypothetical protein